MTRPGTGDRPSADRPGTARAARRPCASPSMCTVVRAAPGTQVTVTWGEHPGAGTPADADLGFPKIRATVAPAPYDAYAATRYRRH